MPKRSNLFQRLVLLINSCLASNAHVEESAMIIDKITGNEREVDILIITHSAGYKINIAIEVVARARKADSTWVESMQSKHSSLSTDKLILVSETGFTLPAIKKASFYGIEAISIQTALSADWKLAAELTATGFFELTTFKYSCTVIYELKNGKRDQFDIPNSAIINSSSENISLDVFVQYVLSLSEVKDILYPRIASMNERNFWFSYTKPGGLWDCEINGNIEHIIEMRVGLDVEHKKNPVEFSTGKYQGTPFISGSSININDKFLFVVTKNKNGISEGVMLDSNGYRKLYNTRELNTNK